MTPDGRLTYWDLISGHILKKGDKILIHGLLGYVYGYVDYCEGSRSKGYFIEFPGINNGEIFSYLNIPKEDKYDFCPEGCNGVGGFPEYDSLENLQKCLIKLYETPFLKVGDTVKVRHREMEGIHYPYCFDLPMADLEGQEFKVVRIEKETSNAYFNRPLFNGDIQRYYLDGEARGWTWHRSMLQLVERAQTEPDQRSRQQRQAESKVVGVNVVDDKYQEIRLKDPVIKSKFHIKV